MSLILNIDTALDTASICLTKDNEVLELMTNDNQKDHAAWLHPAITGILSNNNYTINELEAIAVSIGPGSYTGLRVGLASAKGLCYALNIPLITLNTLKIIAFAAKDEAVELICPVIDARRMEVFTAVYTKALWEKISPHAMIADENSFASALSSGHLLFCGNGCKKLQAVISHKNAAFSNTKANASHLARLSYNCFMENEFSELAYTEPLYIKEFYSPDRKD
jgi:tRNA threonylcarbamoyladenosine biosynthesis protein TsaB